MGKKRRYYREDRSRTSREYDDELDDDWVEEDDRTEEMENFVSKASWSIIAVLTFAILLSFTQVFYTPAAPGLLNDGRYRVVSVSHGKLHVEDLKTGESMSIDDQKLVKAALNGSIKQGDVISR